MSVAKRQLKSNVLKRALNAFLVEPFIIKYNVISVRVLLEQGEELWLARRRIENLLFEEKAVVSHFSAVTLLENATKDDEQKDDFGLAFWIVVDWPDYALSSIETEITKKMFSLGMNIKTCKAIKPRGKKIIPPIRKFIKILQLYIVYIYYDVVYCIYLL